MKLDLLAAEIGSTTTVVSAFTLEPPRLLGQGIAATQQEGGDVAAALERAVEDLAKKLGTADLDWDTFMAASSAAGALHECPRAGLRYDRQGRPGRRPWAQAPWLKWSRRER